MRRRLQREQVDFSASACTLEPTLRLTSIWNGGALVEVRVRAWQDFKKFNLTFPQQVLALDQRSLAHVHLIEKPSVESGATILRVSLDPVEYLHLCYDATQCGFLNTKLAFTFAVSPVPQLSGSFAPRITCAPTIGPPMHPPPPAGAPFTPPPPSPQPKLPPHAPLPPTGPPPPPRPSPPPPGYWLPYPPPPPPPPPPHPLSPPTFLSSEGFDFPLSALAVCGAVLLFIGRQLHPLRAKRLREEAGTSSELVRGSEARGVGRRSLWAGARSAPDDILDVVVDLEEEHVLQIPKKALKSAKALRLAIAKATSTSFGKRAPRAWVAVNDGGDRTELASSMSVTLQFDNQVDEPVSARLTDKTPGQRIREATSARVMPT